MTTNNLTLKEFRLLPRGERFEHAKNYWGSTSAFENSGLFSFSYNAFSTVCLESGFKMEKPIVVTDPDNSTTSDDLIVFTLSNENRPTKKQKTFTLDQDTINEMDSFFNGLSDVEKSRINDMILKEKYSNLNKLKAEHKIKIEYALDTRTRLL